ncbi:MAG: CinA family protein, partial [Alphaproteobacteria bacterium]|nr:CinA family protein [Alphaproteobacteria bacterium]
ITIRGRDDADIERKLAPVQAAVRRQLGNFILAEDDQTLEGVVLAELAKRGASLAVVESFTAGQIAGRLAHLPGAEAIFRLGVIAREPARFAQVLEGAGAAGALDIGTASKLAAEARAESGATHALAVLIALDEGGDRLDFGGTLAIAIADAAGIATREARILGGRDWLRLGAVEMGLDSLRRHLQGLPIDERTDFEKR